jgi:PhnB protein
MRQINPYLTFDGQAEDAFNFYKSVFGGELNGIMRWGDNPQGEGFSDEDKKKVMHTALPIGDSALMGSDFVGMPGQEFSAGNNLTVAITPDSRDDADKLYAGLAEGGKSTMPMQDAFWGGYFGALIDKFGIQWMLNI